MNVFLLSILQNARECGPLHFTSEWLRNSNQRLSRANAWTGRIRRSQESFVAKKYYMKITSSHLYGYFCHVSLCRSEEHTSELQSRGHLVCRLLLEKKKKNESEEQDDPG